MIEFVPIEFKPAFYIFQILAAEAMFSGALQRKSKFILRLAISVAVFAVICFLLPTLLGPTRDALIYMAIFSLTVVIYPVCFASGIFDCLFCATAGVLIQNLSNNISVLGCALFGMNPDIDVDPSSVIFQAPLYIATHIICFFFIAKKLYGKENFGAERKVTLVIMLINIFSLFLVYYLLLQEGMTYYYVPYILFISCNVLSLFLLFGASEYHSLVRTKSSLEEIIRKESQFREMNRHAVDVINMKSHDLKHYLAAIKSGETFSEEHVREIETAVKFYDNAAKTENSVLNTILTEKMILCEHHDIRLSHMVDATCLEEIDAADLAALFSNILDNAINYLKSVEDVSKRLVTLNVFESCGNAVIHTDNYCETEVAFKNGLPVTTNSNQDYHGYGLLSVRYIVQKYGGHMAISTEDGQFKIDIIIPIKDA